MIQLITPLNQVDSSAAYTVGTKTMTKNGNEYIYLPGVASVATYDWVTYITSATGLSYGSVTRLATSGAVGLVGIAQGTIISNKWGWFQIAGTAIGNCNSIATTKAVYASVTVAVVWTTVSTNEMIANAFCTASASDGTTTFLIDHPYITGTLE